MSDFIEYRKARLERYKNIRGKDAKITKGDIPDDVFIKCEGCGELIYFDDLERDLYVCSKCNYHFRLNRYQRLKFTVDEDSFTELFANLKSKNPLEFPNYLEKLEASKKEEKDFDAFICGEATIDSRKVALGILDSYFFMGSMGSVVGEKITRLIEHATATRLPLIIFSASGGARMQEGIFSLIQMAKTAAAIKRHSEAGLLFISVLTHPTTGGVIASYASLGDINIAESEALIGFAGKRVIEQTIKEQLPAGFQSAEFQKEHGFVDIVVDRGKLREILNKILFIHKEE